MVIQDQHVSSRTGNWSLVRPKAVTLFHTHTQSPQLGDVIGSEAEADAVYIWKGDCKDRSVYQTSQFRTSKERAARRED